MPNKEVLQKYGAVPNAVLHHIFKSLSKNYYPSIFSGTVKTVSLLVTGLDKPEFIFASRSTFQPN